MTYTIWVTTNCNLNCKYCYEGSDKPSLNLSEETASEIIKYIVNDFKNNNDTELIINFHGGEPFLNFNAIKYIIENLKMIYKNSNISLEFLATTNMTILNNEVLELIKKDIKDITISIDGTKKTQNLMRPFKNGTGSYDIVVRNSRKILEYIPKCRCRMTFDSSSIYSLATDVCHLIKLGFKTIVPILNVLDKNWNESCSKELKNQIEMIKNYIGNRSELSVSLCEPIDYFDKGKCSGGITSKSIYTDGRIYPCMISTGIAEFAIGDIWSGIDKGKLKKLLDYSNYSNPECIGCAMYKACNSTRCKIVNKIVTNSFHKPQILECEINNLLYEINGYKIR